MRRLRRVAVLLWVVAALTVTGPVVRGADVPAPTAPETLALRDWFAREYGAAEVTSPLASAPATPTAAAGLILPVALPKEAEFYGRVPRKFGGFAELEFVLEFPADFPAAARLYFFVKDWDSLWLNATAALPEPVAGLQRFRLPIAGEAAAQRWQPARHHRPWHQLTPNQLLEYGLKFASPPDAPVHWQGRVVLRAVRLLPAAEPPGDAAVQGFRLLPAAPRVGQLAEAGFTVSYPFTDPFDPRDVDVRAVLELPDGQTVPLRAFYFEDFLLDPADESSPLVPYGRPGFRVRFTPLTPGRHALQLLGRIGRATVEFPETSFTVEPAAPGWRGFIRRDPQDARLLAYSVTGDEFWGQGLNVRSPYDTRQREAFPGSAWENSNLNMYRRLFAKYHAAGINVVEVWLCAWWLGLECIPDAPGNHGLGYYNQWRAWQVDRLLEWAEANDLYLILALHNHGRFSTWCDQEWARNPYNRANGGYLNSPPEYFSTERAADDCRKYLDYAVARWSYSPRLLAWKLFTEIDLAGPSHGWYTNPTVAAWHETMGRYLKLRDPNQHLVTTHWSTDYTRAQASLPLAQLRELDFLTLDAYYRGRRGARQLYTLLDGTLEFQRQVGKPCLITEFGGTPWADTLPQIRQQLHLGLWRGLLGVFPATPCLWWFPLIEEQDLYGEYRALAAFAAGESRRGAVTAQRELAGNLQVCELRTDRRLLVWIFDRAFFFDNDRLHAEAPLRENLAYPVAGLQDGRYLVEFWNCRDGKLLSQQALELPPGGSASITLPPFRGDLAFKIKRRE